MSINGVAVVSTGAAAPAVTSIIERGTLYDYAARHPARRSRLGRAPVYIVPLEGCTQPVVTRHAWHGGLLAKLTGDRFLPPTRAPHELTMSIQLSAIGIRTPAVVAYAVYPAGLFFRRADVMTAEVLDSADLAAILAGESQLVSRQQALVATGVMISAMTSKGVRHPDLNLKNILISRTAGDDIEAWLLDIDRVRIDSNERRAGAANAARLTRSARKWRDRHRAPITDAEIALLADAAFPASA